MLVGNMDGHLQFMHEPLNTKIPFQERLIVSHKGLYPWTS